MPSTVALPAETAAGGDLSAAQLLLTVLGDYWYDSTEHIASAALVAVLAEFGVGEDAARAALSRLCRESRLERVRDGRRTAYRLAAASRDAARARGRALVRFGAEPVEWDGTWTCVAFSVPEADRRRRPALRARLRSLGMAPLFDGLWISPRPLADRIGEALDELGVAGAAVLRATEVPGASGADLAGAWDLGPVRRRLDDIDARIATVAGRVAGGTVGPREALVARTDLMARWRAVAAAHPPLPDRLLPPDWPLRAVRSRLGEVYDALGPLAELRLRHLAGVAPTDRGGPRHHSLDRPA